ncbi:hypothetical protein Q8F55_008872 [Vanrija albida]|uniref:Uncharacterized protein n=1 Tax=Vanrija albida TaxID=181172 RepID=A0ABR3PS07_9TREE
MAPSQRHPTFTTPVKHRRRSSTATSAEIASIVVRGRPSARRLSNLATPQRVAQRSFAERVLDRPQLAVGALITALFLLGTVLAVYFDTALSTSLVHHVHNHAPERIAYFARKGNVLNQLFVKKAWAWTASILLLHLWASPAPLAPSSRLNPQLVASVGRSRGQRLAAIVLGSLAWITFTSWFFGAGLGDRIIASTGGACAVPLPPGLDPGAVEHLLPPGYETPIILHGAITHDKWGHANVRGHIHASSHGGAADSRPARVYLPLPHAFCSHRLPLSPNTHPDLYSLLAEVGEGYTVPRPRWSGGFDISGHAFLLTLGAVLLASELAPSWREVVSPRIGAEQPAGVKGLVYRASTAAGTVLVGIWVWMLLMTAVYFHDPDEKLAGLALGLATAVVINVLVPRTVPGPVIEFKVRGPQRRPSPRIVSDSDENAARREASVSGSGQSTAISIDTSVASATTARGPASAVSVTSVTSDTSVFITSPESAAPELPPVNNVLHAKSE